MNRLAFALGFGIAFIIGIPFLHYKLGGKNPNCRVNSEGQQECCALRSTTRGGTGCSEWKIKERVK